MKHWVFDLDGTLVDTMGMYFSHLETVLNHFDVPFSQKHIELARLFAPLQVLETELGTEKAKAAYDILVTLSRRDLEKVKVFEGVEDTLEHLTNTQKDVALWTARDLDSAMEILEVTGLKKYFRLFVGGKCVEVNKPHPAGLNKIIESLDFHRDHLWMVGDHEHDMMGAHGAGVKGVSVTWPGQSHPVGERLTELSHRHFVCPLEFRDWVKSLG